MNASVLPPEWRRYRDPLTDREILQWTSGESMNHHLYFTNFSVAGNGRTGYFISYRTGYPNVFGIDLDSGEIRQLTDRSDMNTYSPVPSLDGSSLYFSARDCICRLNSNNGETEVLSVFPGAKLGNCSLSNNNSELAVGVRYSGFCELAVLDTRSGKTEICHRMDEVGHVQFCPSDENLMLFSGPAGKRLWCHDRRKVETWRILEEDPDQWFVHESWLGSGPDIIFVCWPYALLDVEHDGKNLRTLSDINAWHPRSDPAGTKIVFDTNHPDRGLYILDLRSKASRVLCFPGASGLGSQWRNDRPADAPGIDTSILRSEVPEDDVPPRPGDAESLYGPQWTHPHPSFSPDGKQVVFTSDRDRFSHVYSLSVPIEII